MQLESYTYGHWTIIANDHATGKHLRVKASGLNPNTITCRVKRGWSVDMALSTPIAAKG